MAIKYLATGRLQGTTAERTALSGTTPTAIPQTSWKELGRTTLSGTADDITVSSLVAKDNIMVLSHIIPSGVLNNVMRLGNGSIDTGSNYAGRYSENGGSDGTDTSATYMVDDRSAEANDQFWTTSITNIANQEKLAITDICKRGTAGAGNAPERVENVGKWTNTSNVLDTFSLHNFGGGDMASGSEVVVLGCDNDEADSGTNFWQELADIEVTSGSTIDTGTITAKKYLWLDLYTVPSGSESYSNLRFNSDTGSNYASRYNTNGGSDSTSTGGSTILFYAPTNNTERYMSAFIINKSDKEKLVIGEGIAQTTAGAGNAPERRELLGKWANTSSSITSIQVISSSGSFTTGTRLRVWGSD